MKSEKLSTEIAALQRKQKETKNAVAKKALSSKIERLKKELDEITTSAQAKTALAKAQSKIREMSQKDFGEFVKKLATKPEFSFLKGMSKSKIKDDIMRVAKPVGWRFRGRTNVKKPTKKDIQEGNNVYYEGRVNRSDVSRTVRLAEGGGVNERMYNFLQDDLMKLKKSIEQGDNEKVEQFFSYWSQHLGQLKTATNERMYNFLSDDLADLDEAIKENNQEEIDKFFSYWTSHISSLKMAKGGKTDFGMLSVKAGIDNNPNPTYADKIAGATHKFAKGGGVYSIGDKVMVKDDGYVKSFEGFDLSQPATITSKNKVKTSAGIKYSYGIEFADGRKPFNNASERSLLPIENKMAEGGNIVVGKKYLNNYRLQNGDSGYQIIEVVDTNYFSVAYGGGKVVRCKIVESSESNTVGEYVEYSKDSIRKYVKYGILKPIDKYATGGGVGEREKSIKNILKGKKYPLTPKELKDLSNKSGYSQGDIEYVFQKINNDLQYKVEYAKGGGVGNYISNIFSKKNKLKVGDILITQKGLPMKNDSPYFKATAGTEIVVEYIKDGNYGIRRSFSEYANEYPIKEIEKFLEEGLLIKKQNYATGGGVGNLRLVVGHRYILDRHKEVSTGEFVPSNLQRYWNVFLDEIINNEYVRVSGFIGDKGKEQYYKIVVKKSSLLPYNQKYATGGGVGDVKVIKDQRGNTLYLTKIDSTHFFLSVNEGSKGNPYHIGQIKNEPYYNEVNEWLMSKYATGGGVGLVNYGDYSPTVSYKIPDEELSNFIDYVYDVYKEQGYTKMQVKNAVNRYLSDLDKQYTWGYGDSLDRERVYEYLLNPKLKGIQNPSLAKGGDVQSPEPHRLHMMAKGGMTFSESVLKEGLSDMLHHLYKAQNELDGIMGYLDRTGQGGMKSALKSKFGLNSISETTEKIDTYLDK